MKEVKAGTFEKIKLTTGRKFSDFTEVTDGLKAGDRVVIDGSLFALTAFNQLN
jgi:multidrug efflux pump subunit AcrA (membrane-fusion protein)